MPCDSRNLGHVLLIVKKSCFLWDNFEMVVYGGEVEDAMASGALGPVVQELWERKIPREYSPTPQV